ncbi:glycosyltransferase family 4 protein [Gammaproteobacteria bacterium]|nr:glycosyltransferase family 4 protein [Gammaproteobacteria bacterium]
MKVVLIMRPRGDGYSLELIYQKIYAELGKLNIEIVMYQMQSNALVPIDDIKKLRNLNADIYHICGDVSYVAIYLLGRNVILTIHDIGHYSNLKGLKKFAYKIIWINLPVYFSNMIFAVSEKTQQRLSSVISFSKEKIRHVPVCTGLDISPVASKKRSDIFTILHVGTAANKNLSNVILAIEHLKCRLVIVGKINSKDLLLLSKLDIKFTSLVDITNEELVAHYQNADLVTFPSFHEGFGLPIIEAQLAGTPVLTSRLSPMKEVAGVAAYLVDPSLVSEIRDGVTNIIGNPELQNQMIEDGFNNSGKYSPERVAKIHMNLYQQLLEKL